MRPSKQVGPRWRGRALGPWRRATTYAGAQVAGTGVRVDQAAVAAAGSATGV
jgi:hypothetical protein